MSLLTWPLRIVAFAAWFTWQVLTAGLAVIRDILTPADLSTPRIVAVPTRCVNDLEVSLVSMAVSLTPGSLVLATEHPPATRASHPNPNPEGHEKTPWREAAVLYVHVLTGTREEALASTREMERRVLDAVRREGAPR